MEKTVSKKPFALRSKRSRLVLVFSLAALFLGIIAVGFFLSYYSVNNLLWSQRAENLTSLMGGITDSTDLYFSDSWKDLDHLTARISSSEYTDETALAGALKTIGTERNEKEEELLLFYSSGRSINGEDVSFVYDDYASATGDAEHTLTTADMTGINGDGSESVLFFSRFSTPLTVGGEEITYLAKKVPATVLDSFFESIRPYDSSSFYLIKQDGSRVYSQRDSNQSVLTGYNVLEFLRNESYSYGTSYDQMKTDLAAKKNGTAQLTLSSRHYMLSYAALPVNDWDLLLALPGDSVAVSVASDTRNVLIAFTLTYSAIVIAGAALIGVLVYNMHQKELAYENEQRLESIAEQERKASEAKGAFLSNMSHDIRTPMNGIVGMLHIAEENPSDTKTVEACLSSIEKSSDHLLSLINDVLDMSRIEAGKIEVKSEPFNLLSVLDSCISIIKGQLDNREVLFHSDISSVKHPYVKGDKVRLSRIITNILGNSVKFTPDGKEISFAVSEENVTENEVTYRFEFKDTGIGMSEEFQKKIFEPFSQEERPDSSSYKGTGLGMAITKRYLDAMGGTITLKSEVDKGTSTTVLLPLVCADPAEVLSLHQAPTPVPLLRGKTILLVEDNDINLTIARHLLEQTKATILTAKDGEEAVQSYLASPEDGLALILMDVMMPVLNGYDATRKIRSSERKDAKTLPIIAMTANAFAEDVLKAKEAGMNDHLAKPIDKDRFYSLLAKYLEPERKA